MTSSAVTPKEKRREFSNDLEMSLIFVALAHLFWSAGQDRFVGVVFGLLGAAHMVCAALYAYADRLRQKAREVRNVQP